MFFFIYQDGSKSPWAFHLVSLWDFMGLLLPEVGFDEID